MPSPRARAASQPGVHTVTSKDSSPTAPSEPDHRLHENGEIVLVGRPRGEIEHIRAVQPTKLGSHRPPSMSRSLGETTKLSDSVARCSRASRVTSRQPRSWARATYSASYVLAQPN
jgi:hypothetical protein